MMMDDKTTGFGEIVAALCQTNMELWREEDKARSDNDIQVAQAKRNVDKLNQKRNNLIEQVDEFFIAHYQKNGEKRG
jgi:uncharacterized phage-like protein YoqJ